MTDNPHRARRDRLMAQLAEGVLLVRGEAPSGVNPNFRYLTGLTEPRGTLLLAPGGVRIGVGREYPGRDYVRGRIVHQVLFLPRPDALAERWGEDAAASVGSVDPAGLGLDAVLAEGELDGVLVRALASSDAFHYVRATPPSLAAAPNPDVAFTERVRRNFLGVRILDATPRVHEMRRIKEPGEIRAIERAIEVTREALGAAMRLARAGMHEYELEAEIARVYRAHNGVHAFEPIVAAGPNAVRLHYQRNSGRIEPGQLVLIDTGAVIDGYHADVTRTFPIDGKLSARQREVYEAVLRAEDAVIERCRPGALLGDLHAAAYDVIAAAGFGEHFVHGTSHHLGLETHDPGDVYRPLEAGAVITVEPGIYLRDEGLGVRIEDDVLITPDGSRVLSQSIPRSPEAVEAALRR
jgi:Xaa-Pro aminopeptidase